MENGNCVGGSGGSAGNQEDGAGSDAENSEEIREITAGESPVATSKSVTD